MYDLIIIGGGPAGLTAAVYARRAEKSVLILEKETAGGQITFSPRVENIPGFVSLSGTEFADKLVDQALAQGADMEFALVTGIEDAEAPVKKVVTDAGTYEARSVIIATGARHRLLGLPREEEFIGNGISFCAVCDGAFYKDGTVGIVGGGNSALQEAVLLAGLVKKLHVFQDLPVLTGEKKLQEELLSKDNVEVHTEVRCEAFLGDDTLTGLRVYDKKAQKTTDYELDGLFVAVGLEPQNEPFSDILKLNAYGYADADETCRTGVPGIFVAGDCRGKRIRQVATAAADGAVAALAACDHLDGR